MTRTNRVPEKRDAEMSRRDLLARLGWSGGAISMLGAGPLPDFGELRLEGLPASQAAAIRLSSNENPYGMCQAARDALQADLENANRYPFAWSTPLHGAVARHLGLPPHSVTRHLLPGTHALAERLGNLCLRCRSARIQNAGGG